MSALMFAILLSLGVWQLHRLAWKEGILAQIARAESSPAVPLPANPPLFAKVSVSGRWAEVSARYRVEARLVSGAEKLGSFLLTPLLRDGAPPVLVNRGWLPDDAPAPQGGEARIEGYILPPAHRFWLTPSDNPAKLRFYTLDPAAIGAGLGVTDLEPFTVVALGPADQLPIPAQSLPRPPNDHLSYALTWFGLAAVLLVVFAVYVRTTLRPDGLRP
jgi:surfeit locus 1 family protein